MHKLVPEYRELYRQGKISRREFLRYSTLLGVSLTTAQAMLAGCTPAPAPATAPTAAAVAATAASAAATAVPAAATAVPMATAVPATAAPVAGAPVRGGVIKVASRVQQIDHPARISWHHQHALIRQIAEYLTYTDENNVTHPMLLEKWEASDDVKTWTLYLRKGIKFNHGPEFTADDVLFNFGQWLNPDVGSSMKGLIEGYISAADVEKVDDYTVKLHCSRAEIGVPEHLFHYVAFMLPKDFGGDFLKQPYGTGAFTLKEYKLGERAVLAARPDYWGKDANGGALPYLDGIEYYELGDGRTAHIAAMQSGQCDIEHEPWVDDFLALKENADIHIEPIATSQCAVVRMRADVEPWNNEKVRMALKLCQKRDEILKKAYYGEGILGQDVHVAPVHPDYAKIETPKYDPERAKALLAEAGYPNGLDVECTVGADFPPDVAIAESLKADALAAGFRINIKQVPGSEYWNVWTEVPLGVTDWSHRPLATMVLSLAYTADAEGKPAPWNETHWVDKEFGDLLNQAGATVDIEKRREIMGKLEKIQQERGSIGIAYFCNVWGIWNKKVHGVVAHPSKYMMLTEAWMDKA